MNKKYIYKDEEYNLDSPSEIVPVINQLLKPKSVIDIGCGIGTFLHCFKNQGVNKVLGIDGNWVDKEKLYNFISPDEFREIDLEKAIYFDNKFDLVICLEVAEHIYEKNADIFVQNIISAGDKILFSAAIPNQLGQNHVNEQLMTYWEEKFSKYNLRIFDIIRPFFWDNPKVKWWYKQNMVLIAPQNFKMPDLPANILKNVVHYELFNERAKELNNIVKGKFGSWFYLKLLLKSILPFMAKNQ